MLCCTVLRAVSKRIPVLSCPGKMRESHWVQSVLGIVFSIGVYCFEEMNQRTLYWQHDMATKSFTCKFWILKPTLLNVVEHARNNHHFIKCQPGLWGLEGGCYIYQNHLHEDAGCELGSINWDLKGGSMAHLPTALAVWFCSFTPHIYSISRSRWLYLWNKYLVSNHFPKPPPLTLVQATAVCCLGQCSSLQTGASASTLVSTQQLMGA